MIGVRVPATSANMGAGFDTLGIALNLYSRLEVEERKNGLEIIAKCGGEHIRCDRNNLVYRAMREVFGAVGYRPRGLYINQKSDIPVTRGLGSSSACIVGGMLAANALSGRRLKYSDIVDMAADMEGHPDNVGPALYGGFCVSARIGGRTVVKSAKLAGGLKLAAMIPDFRVLTGRSRGTLPEYVRLRDAAANISSALLLREALISGDYDMLRCGVRDRLHQPYRKNSIEGFDEILETTYKNGSRATYISGSGPAIISILTDGAERFKSRMESFLAGSPDRWRCLLLETDNVGAVVSEYI